MPITTRHFYLAIANAEEPEPREGCQEHTGTDCPPDAPDPRVNDQTPSVVVAYLVACAVVILAGLVYLLAQVQWQ